MDLLENELSDPINHWYYRYKFTVIKKFMDSNPQIRSVADIGAGSALFTKELLRKDMSLRVVAIDTGYEIEGTDLNFPNLEYRRSVKSLNVDLYIFTDVIEHVENDLKFIKSYSDLSKSGTFFVFTAPCFMSLWSGHDIFLKHYRRYTLYEMRSVIEKSGLKIIESKYLFSTIFPIVWILRKFSRNQQVKSQMRETNFLTNYLLNNIMKIDYLIASKAKFGISGIVIAYK